MLTRLPTELLSIVFEQLESKNNKKDLCSLARTSRIANAAATPLLYADLLVVFTPETDLTAAQPTHDFVGTERRRAALRHVKAIHFVADVYEARKDRCRHLYNRAHLIGDNREGLDDDENYGLRALAKGAMSVLKWIREGALAAFSWELGTCIPATVQRYLIRCQPKIDHISLITGFKCNLTDVDMPDAPVSLVENVGQRLKTLTWRSPSTMRSLQSLAKMLRYHAQTIEELDIDFIALWLVPHNFGRRNHTELGWWPLGVNWKTLIPIANFKHGVPQVDPLQHKVLGLNRGQRRPRFMALRSLAFTAVSLREFHIEFAWAFNYIKLQRLTLRDCPGLTWTLRMLSRMREPFELKSLELIVRPNQVRGPHHVDVLKYLARFITRLPKLENLFLMLRYYAKYAPHVWHALRRRGPLKKFVFHQRSFPSGTYFDYGWIETLDLSIDNAADMMNMVTDTGVQSLGLRDVPARLESMLSLDASKSKVKFLHIREPGSRPRHSSDDQTASLPSKESERNDIDFYGPLEDGAYHDACMSDAFVVSHSGDSDAEEWEFDVDTTDTDDSSADPAEVKAWPESIDSLLHDPPNSSHPLQTTLPEALRRAAPGLSLPTLRFIHWAFGPQGLPDLQHIVLGDFSHGRRYDIDWRFFARRETSTDDEVPMVEVDVSDEKLSSVLAENMDLLKACPLERLFESDEFEPLSGHGRHFPGRY